MYANFGADKEIDSSEIGRKTSKVYEKNPVCNSYYIVSEISNNSQSGYYQSLLGYDTVDWSVDEVIKSENKMIFCFKKPKNDFEPKKKDDKQ